MSRSDKWDPSEHVQRYWTFKDLARLSAHGKPHTKLTLDVLGIFLSVWLPIPASYSLKRKKALYGTVHRVKPDSDNITKAVKDALFANDQRIAIDRCVKRYVREGEQPRTEVRLLLA